MTLTIMNSWSTLIWNYSNFTPNPVSVYLPGGRLDHTAACIDIIDRGCGWASIRHYDSPPIAQYPIKSPINQK